MDKRKRFFLLAATFAATAGAAFGQLSLNGFPSRFLGQPTKDLRNANPNLVEGREFYYPRGIAVDTSATPPVLYVADSSNNRILAWRNANSFNNGQKADFVIGQRDFYTTVPQGPGREIRSGFAFPSGMAVDVTGNLYVVDSGNNRILRFPKPYAQTDDLKQADMVIGQPDFTSNKPNQGLTPSATTFFTSNGQQVYTGSILFDQLGNMWVSDGGNHRVLRYPAAALQKGTNNPAADQALGQFALTTANRNEGADRSNKIALLFPSALAIDNFARMYVSDSLNRVLVYTNPQTGASASRIIGVIRPVAGGPPVPDINESTLGKVLNGSPVNPEGIIILGGTPAVVDTGNNRIVRYDPYESWPAEATAFGPPARVVYGQPDYISNKANQGAPEPTASSLNGPTNAVVANNQLYLCDTNNHRVLVFPINNGTIGAASRVLGQTDFAYNSPNYIEGREFNVFAGFVGLPTGVGVSDGAGIILDERSVPPRLYIADTYNNRILGFKDARAVNTGDRADIVIGQRDFFRSLANDPTNDINQYTERGLFLPSGMAVDAAGNLYVADSGNGRVLRFPRPFDQPAAAIRPDLVLGQSSFFVKNPDATSRTMGRPFGLAFTVDGHLLVSDATFNRVLFFRRPDGGDFSNGQAAEKVFGQPDFTTVTISLSPNRLLSPHHIGTDTDDRLYVADTGNNRVLVYDRITAAGVDPSPALSIPGVNGPHGLFVSKDTGEIWVADTLNRSSCHLKRFDQIVFNPTCDARVNVQGGTFPLALTLDSAGNLMVVESANRIAIYFQGARIYNGASQLQRPLAPGMYATLKTVPGAFNQKFTDQTVVFDQVPNPIPMKSVLGDLQVIVNDTPSPLHFISPQQINFLVPKSTPSSGDVDVVVQKQSSGQIIAATTMSMATASPAFFTRTGDGTGQIAAINNADNTINDPTNPALRGTYVTLYGTGIGPVANQPDDGTPSQGENPSKSEVRVAVNTAFVDAANIAYSGLAPTLIGVWQLTFKIPDSVPPNPLVQVAAIVSSIPTNTDSFGNRIVTTIAVK